LDIIFLKLENNIMNHFLGRFRGDLDLLTPKLPLPFAREKFKGQKGLGHSEISLENG
jgi:hypothetical protein